MSDDNSYKVTVEWDRSSEYCGVCTVNTKEVTNITRLAGGTYQGTTILSSDDIVDSIVAMFNENSYTVPFTIVVPPTITSFTISGTYPTTNGVLQTELKENDKITCSIATDKDIDTIEFVDEGAFSSQSVNVSTGTSFTNIIGIIANRGDATLDFNGKIRVRSTQGSWSEYVLSSNTVKLNNIKPSMTFGAISYPSGQLAIKGTESATLNYTLSNTDICTPSIIGNDLSLGTQTSTSLIVTRLATGTTTYNDGTINNVSLSLIRNANGSNVVYNTGVAIVTNPAILTSQSLGTYNIMSGSGTVTNTLTFSQKCKVKSISALSTNKGTLATGVTSIYNNSYDLGISAQDSDIHSSTSNSLGLVVTGLSGLDSSGISINYYIRGFANKVMSFVYPSLSQALGTTVVDVSKLVVNGYILTSPTFEICKVYENNSTNINNDTADYYSISSDKLNLLLPN
jgi:hypothetical protein